MEKEGFAPMSFEEQQRVKLKHDATFFSRREAYMRAAEEGKQVEIVDKDEEDKFVIGSKGPKDMRNTTAVTSTAEKLGTNDPKKGKGEYFPKIFIETSKIPKIY